MGYESRRCKPCEGDVPPLSGEQADRLVAQECPLWRREGDWIHRDWTLRDFAAAMSFARDVADLAEDEGHHPDLHITGYRNVRLSLQTHAVGGLSENDIILAAKIDRLPTGRAD